MHARIPQPRLRVGFLRGVHDDDDDDETRVVENWTSVGLRKFFFRAGNPRSMSCLSRITWSRLAWRKRRREDREDFALNIPDSPLCSEEDSLHISSHTEYVSASRLSSRVLPLSLMNEALVDILVIVVGVKHEPVARRNIAR